jgi:integrase/recombinase XerD
MENIPKVKRREISTYKPTDLWTEEDDALFYKYCPSLRDRCWHAISRDTGCRPAEMLKLKIKDVVMQQLESGHHIARITVNGKTGTRNVRLNNAYPRFKDWLSNGHPFAANPNSFLFCGTGTKNKGRRLATTNTMYVVYNMYKTIAFPKLLQDPLVTEEDKRKIRDLLKKPWNPYVRRHTAATEISRVLKDSVLIDQYMGWSHAGNTRQKYQHYFGDDAFDAMLTFADGLISPNNPLLNGKKNILKPRQCPNCDESNTPESRFCSKCKFVLSFDAFQEAIGEKKKAAKESEQQRKALAEVQSRQLEMEERMISNYDRLYHEVMRLSSTRLAGIKDKRKREEEMNVLGVTEVGVLDEIEQREEEEEAAAARAQERRFEKQEEEDDIDYMAELEIEEEKKRVKQQQQET